MSRRKIFFGYWMILAAFLCLAVNSGTGYYCFGVFVIPLQKELGWSRGEIMTAFTLFLLFSGLLSPLVGRLIDRYGAQKILAIGALIAGIGFIMLDQLHTLSSFYVGWAIRGVGSAATGTVPAALIVSNWFKRRRGFAIGIMGTGYGVGGSVLPPLIGGYIIPHYGWRTAYFVMAILTWLVIPLALLIIKTKPADIGLYPDGETAQTPSQEEKKESPAVESMSLRRAFSTRTLWLLCIGFAVSNFSISAIVQNQAPHLQDIGFPMATAATALGAVGIGSLVGKFLFGGLSDKIKPKYACALGCVFQLAAVLILSKMQATSPVALIWVYALIAGLGIGSWLPTMSILVANNFGLASYGAIFGITNMALSIGSAIGPLVAGNMYDAMHTYQQAFILLAALYAIALPVILAVQPPQAKETKYTAGN